MLYNRKDVPELNYLKHRHDDFDQFVDYEKTILNSSLSPYMYENDLMLSWLNKMQPLVSILFDQMNVMKNFKNYMVDKYYYKHSK
jgi:hypothetical protein